MWPDLLGPGWIFGVLMTVDLFALSLALVWWLGDFRAPRQTADPIQEIWRLYERGDLTRQEFDRLRARVRDGGDAVELTRVGDVFALPVIRGGNITSVPGSQILR